MNNTEIGSVPSSVLGMLADLNLKLKHGSITPINLERFLKGQNPFIVASPEQFSTESQLQSWTLFYREEFNQTLDFSVIQIPEKREGFNRLIIVPKGMTMNRAYKACEKHFPCWRYNNDLDTAVPTNDRTPSESYAIWVRDRVEADEELKKLSANDLVEQKVGGITLLERILLELKYFRETGKHLDIKNVTLCSGSRDADGSVPDAFWLGGEFGVRWGYCDFRGSDLRSREAVSL
ncbi:MAG: hypothetical protein NUV47_03220 [Patescibacteria group bacterium]|nr:hypothetical protein [Patescibacteria group bacterium]